LKIDQIDQSNIEFKNKAGQYISKKAKLQDKGTDKNTLEFQVCLQDAVKLSQNARNNKCKTIHMEYQN
jgi:hypothetical protein